MTTAMMPAIASFRGEYEFLSNFSRAAGLTPVEYRYQARKSLTRDGGDWIMAAPTPGEAKRRGRQVPCVPDWGCIKRAVMLDLVREKFSAPQLGARLVATRGRTLIEGNGWGDWYWGALDVNIQVPPGPPPLWSDQVSGYWCGHNWLGRILMMVRDVLDPQA